MQGFTAVDAKIAEARRKYQRLRGIQRVPEFSDALNDFVIAARSIELVLSFQFGFGDLRHSAEGLAIKSRLSPTDTAERKRFDAWLHREGNAIREHFLKLERDQSVHRSGQASVNYYPKSHSDLAIEAGTPFRSALVIRRGQVGLPLENDMRFFYKLPDGSEAEVLTLCDEFIAKIEELVEFARCEPWK